MTNTKFEVTWEYFKILKTKDIVYISNYFDLYHATIVHPCQL